MPGALLQYRTEISLTMARQTLVYGFDSIKVWEPSVAINRVVRASIRQYVYDVLAREIKERLEAGRKLPPNRELATRFNTSSFTISQALRDLARDGYVVSRNGVGTFIANTRPHLSIGDSIAICMSGHGHIYGDLALLMSRRLQQARFLPLLVELSASDGAQNLEEVARSGVNTFFVHGSIHFDHEVLNKPLLRDRNVIGFLRWEAPRRSNQHLVLSDLEAGAREVAHCLWERGRRRLLICASTERHVRMGQLAGVDERPPRDCRNPSTVVAETWQQLGGRWDFFEVPPASHKHLTMDEQALLARFDDARQRPTAVFSAQDNLVHQVQAVLGREQPAVLETVDFFGFYDTPWSHAGQPPFSSVDLDLDEVAREACSLMERLRDEPQLPPVTHLIPPKLALRF